MKITLLAKKVSKVEGKKVQVNIAQIAEVLKCINIVLDGEFYKVVRKA